MSVLYLSYDGLMEQLGQSQVLPYLRRLARGRPIILLTYEKSRDLDDPERKESFSRVAKEAGIRWIPLRYHKTPSALATAFDLAVGFAICIYQCITSQVRTDGVPQHAPQQATVLLLADGHVASADAGGPPDHTVGYLAVRFDD